MTDLPNYDFFVTENSVTKTSSSKTDGYSISERCLKMPSRSIYGIALLQREQKLAQADQKLLEKRKFFQKCITASTQKRADLMTRQGELQDQMRKFEGFVRDNESKRVRAMSKYQNEQYLVEVRNEEENQLKGQLKEIKIEYEQTKKRVTKYKMYEDYLLRVIDLLPADYIKIADNVIGGLIMRYNTLYETNLSLVKEMNEKSEHIRQAHAHLLSLREEHSSRILTLNSKLAALYTKRERTNEDFQRQEQQFTNTHKELRTQLSLFGTVIRSVDNLVSKCGWPYTAKEENQTLRTKLTRIREYILTMRKIIVEIELDNERTSA